MLTVTLPDGAQKQFESAVTVHDVAASIGAGSSRKACRIYRKASFTVLGRRLVFDKNKGRAFGAGFTLNVDDVEG